MAVFGRDPGNEVGEIVLSPRRAQEDRSISREDHFYTIALTEARLFGYCQRNPNRQTVPPFRDGRFLSHMYLL
jgi:hypothetical protein